MWGNMQAMVWGFLTAVLAMALPISAHSFGNPGIQEGAGYMQRNFYVYVSLDSERCIAVYRMNPVKGDLTFLKKITTDGTPGSLALDPAKGRLYAAMRSIQSISSFRLDFRTGDLSLLNTVPAAGNPVYVGMDKSGKFLLTAYFADSKAAVYKIAEDGSLKSGALQILVTAENAHSIQTDPTNRFVLIPCRTGETIHQLRFDPSNGNLTPNIPERTTTASKTGPRHFAFHPRLSLVYFVNEFSSTVTAYHLDPVHGTLTTPLQSISALPEDFKGTSTGADIHLTPDGRFLYTSNRGHESIAAFAVDERTGMLSSLGTTATEKTPRSFVIDPTGQFLYAAGQGSGNLAAYRIDNKTGRLTPLAAYEVGRNPVWVLTAEVSSN
jgi:6-phosphogluconolactonase